MKRSLFCIIGICLLLLFTNSCNQKSLIADFDIVPKVGSIQIYSGENFELSRSALILIPNGNEAMERNAHFLNNYLSDIHGFILEIQGYVMMADYHYPENTIVLEIDPNLESTESYMIDISQDNIIIRGGSEAGVFYGIQSLRKSMWNKAKQFSAIRVSDKPAFNYRGMHLDVSRHFRTVEEVKQYIDMIALHNFNKLHWHLTDDQGWRVEILKYPKLAEVGSVRKETSVAGNRSAFDGTPHGGYYTQQEIKDVVKYAADRYITVIPEVDLPGHMLAALKAYPHLGCTGGPYETATTWGVFDDVLCAGNDSTLIFIEDVLNEIIDLFPDSPYIHIGGDECPKTRWKACPKCQQKIRELGFRSDSKHTAEEYLQSYIITHASKIVEKRGKKIIGWDEILEGGLAPNATVMSWRGIDGGVTAAKLGHDVIMTPNSHLYFDYYQSLDTDNEPPANGNYISLERVYEFDPIPSDLPENRKRHILGAQANMWAESMPTFDIVQYMALPRIAALSEVVWSYEKNRSFDDFTVRLKNLMKIYDLYDYNYAKHLFDIAHQVNPDQSGKYVEFVLSTLDQATILYTIDGTTPKKGSKATKIYKQPLVISTDAIINAVAYRDGDYSRIFKDSVIYSKATGKNITLASAPHRSYSHNGAQTLVDGLKGGKNFKQNRWLGFNSTPLNATIDLGSEGEISQIIFNLNVVKESWIFDARSYHISISKDGVHYNEIASEELPPMKPDDPNGIKRYDIRFDPQTARYVNVVINPEPVIPDWHGGKGSKGFIFVDEISVY